MLCVGCGDDEDLAGDAERGRAGTGDAATAAAGGSGATNAMQAGAGTRASGGAGASGAGTGAAAGTGASGATAGTGTTGSGGSSASGTGGTGASDPEPQDVCATLPAGCIALCEGGQCSCDCSAADPCPASAPGQDTPCNTVSLCGYGEPACHQIFECFTDVWKKVSDTCAEGPTGSCPPTLEDALATPCIDRRCGYDAQICQCSSPACSGAFFEPTTMCFGPGPAACIEPQVVGDDCPREGQRCGASCCGVQYTCTDGTWTSALLPCPP
jgi:hypothetical protein